MRCYSSFLCCLLLASAGGAQASVFEGIPGGTGQILDLDDAHGLPLLSNVRFLPMEISGRTCLDAVSAGSAQLRGDIPGANRILLPGEDGSLYHYQTVRVEEQVFGFLLVEESGSARIVAEFAGWGPEGLASPTSGFVAIDPAGTTLWVFSVPEVGGDLFEINLATGVSTNRTPGSEPLRFLDHGLALFQSFGIAMTDEGPLRLNRAGGPVHWFAFEGAKPAWFGADVVASDDDSTFAFIAGQSESSTHVYYGRVGGTLKRASDTVTGLTHAGYAYDTGKGPWLALSTDGSACAWVTQGASRELFVCKLNTVNTNEVQVTHEARFTDTLNDSGVVVFFSPNELVALVGDESGSEVPKIDNGDFYLVDVTTALNHPSGGAGMIVKNLSGTSGDSSQPFLEYGTLTNVGGIYRVSGFEGLLALDSEFKRVVSTDWNGAVTILVEGVEMINDLYRVGDEVVMDVLLSGSVGVDEADERSALYRLVPQSMAVSPLVEAPPGGFFRGLATLEDGTLAAVATLDTDEEWLGMIGLLSGTTSLLTTLPLTYGPTLGFNLAGSLIFTVELSGSTYFLEWSPTGLKLIALSPSGYVLPGR